MAKIADYDRAGQSIWSDYLRRSFIESGEFENLIHQGLSGVTSNPTIFEKAISGSTDYDADLKRLVQERKSNREIYEFLALEDISRTAQLLKPVFDSSKGTDGFVSMEVDPAISNDSKAMVDEARRFFHRLNQPNVMIKIPATEAGFRAIETLTADGINVNVTLIFSLKQYERAAEAYIAGLEKFANSGGNLGKICSVASFFVSRIDSAVDKELEKNADSRARELEGKIGIANAKVAYARFREIFSGDRWEKLRSNGARTQKVLWASTSTKNPSYPDTLYVDNLVGPDTINTLPPATIRALLDHGRAQNSIEQGLDQARKELESLSEFGINFENVTKKLEDEGVSKFTKSIDSLFDKIAQKRDRMLSEPYLEPRVRPGDFQSKIDTALNRMSSDSIVRRIWNHDHTVWKSEPTEISNRLGWLDAPAVMEENVDRIEGFVDEVRSDGYTDVLLIGMGGSSLAPEVFAKTFGTSEGFLKLSVLDSIDPKTIESHLKGLDLTKSLFVVASKSGETIETLSLLKFFYNKVLELLRGEGSAKPRGNEEEDLTVSEENKDKAGRHFVAITDAETKLDKIAQDWHFRRKFVNDPNIGGRYSALSYFGLVPAALIGVDLRRLLDNALTMVAACESCVNVKDNPGLWLGAFIGEFALSGRNKLTFVASQSIESFCNWVEQLIAESTGKEGRGILPVVGEILTTPEHYGQDRIFVHIQLGNDNSHNSDLAALEAKGFPIVTLRIRDPYELGKEFFQWEFATATAGHILGINPFNQPNVESSKKNSRANVSQYQKSGKFSSEPYSAVSIEGMKISNPSSSETNLRRVLLSFIEENKKAGSYISLQAYLQNNPETERLLQEFRTELRDNFKLATTLGFGPRFLHSSGQLHKGDSGAGLFIQLYLDQDRRKEDDIPIPDEIGSTRSSLTFGLLTMAEAVGDRKALEEQNRAVLGIGIVKDIGSALASLRDSVSTEQFPRSTTKSARNEPERNSAK